jgi:hypothetical protein
MTNQDGDSFEVSQQAILLLNAGVSLDSIRAANGTVTKLEGERKVLAAEQEMDASRKVSGGGYKADKIAQLDGAIASAKQTFATALQEGSERAAALAADTGAVEKDANEENEEVQRPEGHTGQEE